jgi:hypothetical protein
MTLLKRPVKYDMTKPVDQMLIMREKESFSYAQEIQKTFGVIEKVLDWCKDELGGEWRWQLLEMSSERKPGRYCFFFDSERDFLAFTLKWT